MFGLFRSPPFNDPDLGLFERSRGRWRGQIVLAGKPLRLAVAGAHGAPDAQALAVAKLLPAIWSSNREAVARALIEHLEPYREAVAAGEVEPPIVRFRSSLSRWMFGSSWSSSQPPSRR